MRYYLRRSNKKPVFGRFGYPEKSEYWMLVGGTVTMSLTGVMMWAYFRFGRLFTDWWVSAARSWHFWEAIVASLAIVVWHFYQVMFDPDVAPMNFAWLDGKVPAEHTPSHSMDIGTEPTPVLHDGLGNGFHASSAFQAPSPNGTEAHNGAKEVNDVEQK